MDLVFDIISWVLLSAGGVFVLIGGIGALRMPNLYTRMHAASVTDSIGAVLVLLGVMVQAGLSLATIKLGAILIFLLITGPTASYALASAAVLAGLKPEENPGTKETAPAAATNSRSDSGRSA